MSSPYAVSVVLSTYNRSRLLLTAIERLLRQAPDTPDYEVVIVDNNSTDDTRAVVASLLSMAGGRLRYVFEAQQGLPYARNAGIRAAQGAVIAFTDDDVRVSSHWVRVIDETFAAHAEVECLGGRTLPAWPAPPPRWLTRSHWVGPLALQDYGTTPIVMDARHPRCLAGANLAVRTRVFDRLGGFSPDFPRAQDTEFLLRLYRSGLRALYVPEMLAYASVQPDRLTKFYHRRWHSEIGRFNALMQFEELAHPVLGLRSEVPAVRRLFGVPAFAVRQLAVELWRWAQSTMARRESQAFLHENRARSLVSYMRAARTLSARRSVPRAPVVVRSVR